MQMCAMSSNLISSLNQGIDARRHGNFERAREHFQAAITEARRIKDYEGEANALLELSAVVRESDKDFAAARKLLKDCLSIYTQLRFERGKAYAMSNLGSLAFDEGKEDDSLQWLNKALVVFEREQDKYGIAMTLHQIGRVRKRRGDFTTAEEHLRRSLLIFEGLNQKFAIGQVLLSLAEISFVYHQDRRQAELLLNRSRALFEELGLPSEIEKVQRNMALLSKH
jgi:tetratricopeptide (TPR) repeat protein